MPLVPASLPDDCSPCAPAPSTDRIELAAQAICDALRSNRLSRTAGGERVIDALLVCAGFRRPGEEPRDDADDFRWAVRRMIEAGLLEVVESEATQTTNAPPNERDDLVWAFRERLFPPESQTPQRLFRATIQLWAKFQGGGPLLGSTPVAGRKGKKVNDKMILLLHKEPLESLNWSVRKWASMIGCVPATVTGTETWKKTLPRLKALHCVEGMKKMDQARLVSKGMPVKKK